MSEPQGGGLPYPRCPALLLGMVAWKFSAFLAQYGTHLLSDFILELLVVSQRCYGT